MLQNSMGDLLWEVQSSVQGYRTTGKDGYLTSISDHIFVRDRENSVDFELP